LSELNAACSKASAKGFDSSPDCAQQWQTAVACLIGAAEGRDFLMHARIGMLRALNRNVVREFNPDRKDTHWGRRKLKRDM